MNLEDRSGWAQALIFLLAGVTGLFILWPGVSGPFIFDDFVNINRLGAVGCVTDEYSFLRYTFGGSSALGRPLSFLTFLLQDFCWPTNPAPMKAFNVLWHLLNFCLIILLVRKILRIGNVQGGSWIALLVAIIWLVHPINVSAMFLTVQRMTLLMSSCIIVGLLMYLRGREVVSSRPLSGHALMWGGLAFGGIIGGLFKETAVGMPFYVIALELTLLSALSRGPKKWWRAFFAICVLGPILLIFAYVTLDPMGRMSHVWSLRTFTAWERILTEFRVLFVYARQILLPDLTQFGIYQDSISVSQSLFLPGSTFFALTAWVTLITVVIIKRHRMPLISLGVLWFFGGHLLEGFTIPLELYFEHRNYLPSLGLLFAVAGIYTYMPVKARRWSLPLIVAFGFTLGFMTFSNSVVWGDKKLLAKAWMMENPESLRAAQQYVKTMIDMGRYEEAGQIMARFIKEEESQDITMATSALAWECPKNFDSRWRDLVVFARTAPLAQNMNETVKITLLKNNTCTALTTDHVRALLRGLMSNRHWVGSPQLRESLYLLYAYTYRKDGYLSPAMYFMDRAYDEVAEPMIPHTQALWLLEAGLEREALRYINKALKTPEKTKLITIKGRPEFKDLKEAILYRIKKKESRDVQADAHNSSKE